jgi:hypothetical protein
MLKTSTDQKEEMVQVCEPEAGRNLNDVEDELRDQDCQEGRT